RRWPTGKCDGPDVLLVARDYDILGGRKTNGRRPEDSLMDDPKRASTDHPIHELLARRGSPYAFADRLVLEDELRSLFEAARWAPSSYNEQPWAYIVATKGNPEAHARLVSCLVEGNQPWAQAAPVLALGCVRLNFARNGKPNAAAQHDL